MANLGTLAGVQRSGRLTHLAPLVAVIVSAVALMHSLPGTGTHPTPMASAVSHIGMSHGPEPVSAGEVAPIGMDGKRAPGHGGDGLAHLCLAVLTALILGIGGGLFLRRLTTRRRATASSAGPDGHLKIRPPPRPAGRSLLASVCVLRV